MIKQAIIPLAGLGTRMLPLTSVTPKELLPINGRPNLEYILETLVLECQHDQILNFHPIVQIFPSLMGERKVWKREASVAKWSAAIQDIPHVRKTTSLIRTLTQSRNIHAHHGFRNQNEQQAALIVLMNLKSF